MPRLGRLMPLLAILVVACSPELSHRLCRSPEDCFVGERCSEEGVCLVDLPDTTEDPAEDSADPPDDLEGGDPSDLSGEVDEADGGDADSDSDEDAGDLTDGGDGDEPPIDGGDADDSGDSGDVRTCEAEEQYPFSRPIKLWERCVPQLELQTATCEDRAGPAFDSTMETCSTYPRADALVEIPLQNVRLDDTIRGYFPFEGSPGNLGADVRIECVDGCSGPTYEAGVGGQGALLDGVLTLTSSDAEAGLRPSEAWSVAFWLQLCQTAGGIDCPESDHGILNTTGGAGVFDLRITFLPRDDGENGIQLLVPADDRRLLAEVTPAALKEANWIEPEDRWIHLALVSSPATDAPRFYLNGAQEPTAWTEESTGAPDQWQGFRLGSAPDEETVFPGVYDEFIFADRAFSPAEIATMAESRAPLGASLVAAPGTHPSFEHVAVIDSGGRLVPYEIVGVRPGPPPDMPTTGGCHLSFDEAVNNDDGARVRDCTGLFTTADDAKQAAGRFVHEGDQSLYFEDEASAFNTGWLVAPAETDGATSFEFWLSPDTTGDVVIIGDPAVIALELEEDEDGALKLFASYDNASGIDTAEPTVVIPRGRWSHIALVLETDGRFTVYIDGIDRDVSCGTGCNGLTVGDAHSFHFGSPVHGTSFRGRIDDFVAYHGVRDVEQIRRRARPELPTVRFIAHTTEVPESAETECDRHFASHSLVWGRPVSETRSALVDDCVGLLSSCNGYYGWWDFEGQVPGFALDRTSANAHLVAQTCAEPGRAHGLHSTAAVSHSGNPLPCLAGHVDIPGEIEGDESVRLTIEAVAQLDRVIEADGGEAVLVSLFTGPAGEEVLRFGVDRDAHPLFRYSTDHGTFEASADSTVSLGRYLPLAVTRLFPGIESTLLVGTDVDRVEDDSSGALGGRGDGAHFRVFTAGMAPTETAWFDGALEELRVTSLLPNWATDGEPGEGALDPMPVGYTVWSTGIAEGGICPE